MAPIPKGHVYSPAEFDTEMVNFDKVADKCEKVKASAVKLRAAERDMLKGAESLRDMFEHIVHGSKEYLKDLFGSGGTAAQRFARVKEIVETFVLSEMNCNDQRWGHLKNVIKVIEEILDKYGIGWKGWSGPPKAPESLAYESFSTMKNPEQDLPESTCVRRWKQRRLAPGTEYRFEPVLKGCSALGVNYSSYPPLPEGMTLDPTTGVISGEPTLGGQCDPVTYTITATNGAGSTKTTLEFCVQDAPPWGITYSIGAQKECFTGDHIKWQCASEGGAATKYEISPPLPAGLKFDDKSGAISGIPLKPAKEATYTISASNNSGSCKAQLTFGVLCSPPVLVEYPDASPTLPYGKVVYLTPNVELKRQAASLQKAAKWGRIFCASGAYVGTKWGKARQVMLGTTVNVHDLPDLEFSVTPELPPGLSLNSKSGHISGAPTEETAQQIYKVTCKNDGGSCTANVLLGVKLIPPSQMKYPEAKAVVFTGSPVSFEPEVQGLVDSWEVEPALPAGLSLDRSMGTICGIPTECCADQVYTISAVNKAGKTSSKLTFGVQRPEPKNVAYKNLSVEYPVGREVEMRPTVDGEVDAWTIEPALPSGMQVDPQTGILSGTPQEVAESLVYTISAKNESGVCKATVAFSVKLIPPEHISYPQVDDEYGVGEPIRLAPEIVGGATKWSVEPALPDGVVLDPKTGEISGSPTTVSPETSYTVVAENEAGGTSAVITFKVASRAPEGLTYPAASSNDASYKNVLQIGQEVSWEPELSQNLGATFSLDKPLPPGLTFDEATGAISGAATEPFELQEFTITAKNKAGETQTKLKLMVAKPPPPPEPMKCQTGESDDAGLADRLAAMDGELNEEQQREIGASSHFIKILMAVTKLEDLPADPSVDGVRNMNWMYWIVHRAYLNDPTLDTVDFTSAAMPLPHVEPRIAPKLMKAIHTNSFVKRLKLSNSNLQKPQGAQLAEALRDNKTVELLDVQSCCLDSEKVRMIAEALTANLDSMISELKLEGQQQQPTFGRPVEEALCKLCQTNSRILKLSCTIKDAHWQNETNKAIMKNNDAARRARKAAAGIEDKPIVVEVKAVKRVLTKVVLSHVPNKAVYDVFDDDNPKHYLIRLFVSKNKTFPTKDQLQKFAQACEKPLKFAEVATCIKDAYVLVFNGFKGGKITLMENNSAFVGDMVTWTEKNDRFSFDLWPKKDERYLFESSGSAPIVVEDAVAEWLEPQEKRLDGTTPLTKDEFVAKYGDEADAKWASGGAWK